MASKTEKIMTIARDTRDRISRGELPEFNAKYRVNVISYSWKHHKELSKVKDINEVGKFYDSLISDRIGIEQVPRTVRSRGCVLPNRDRPPFMYLNLSRFSEFLDNVGTDESREISKVFRMTEVKNSTDEYEIQTVMDCINTIQTYVDKGILSAMSRSDLGIFSVYLMNFQESLDKVRNPEPNPEPEKTGAQNVPIEPLEGIESSKTYLDTSEVIKGIDSELSHVLGSMPIVRLHADKVELEQDDSRVSEDVNPIPEYTIVSDHRFSMDNGRFYHKIEFYDRFPNGKFKQGRAIYPSKDSDELVEIHIQTDCNNTSKFEIIWNSSEN